VSLINRKYSTHHYDIDFFVPWGYDVVHNGRYESGLVKVRERQPGKLSKPGLMIFFFSIS
jgi:hypothetical protein